MLDRMQRRMHTIQRYREDQLIRKVHPQGIGFKCKGIRRLKVASSQRFASLSRLSIKSSNKVRYLHPAPDPLKWAVLNHLQFLQNIHLSSQDGFGVVSDGTFLHYNQVLCLLKTRHLIGDPMRIVDGLRITFDHGVVAVHSLENLVFQLDDDLVTPRTPRHLCSDIGRCTIAVALLDEVSLLDQRLAHLNHLWTKLTLILGSEGYLGSGTAKGWDKKARAACLEPESCSH